MPGILDVDGNVVNLHRMRLAIIYEQECKRPMRAYFVQDAVVGARMQRDEREKKYEREKERSCSQNQDKGPSR